LAATTPPILHELGYDAEHVSDLQERGLIA
jgi:hypothetical protein